MRTNPILLTAIAVLASFATASAQVPDSVGTWQPPSPEEVRKDLFTWLDTQTVDDATREALDAKWEKAAALSPRETLDTLADSLALVHDGAADLVELCSGPPPRGILPGQPVLDDQEAAPLVRNNLRLYYARWLAQHDLYDEALVFVESLSPQDVVDPAALLFYQSVAHHRVVNIDESRTAALRLLEREDDLPERYRQLAELMVADVKGLKDDSLDHIARRMDDVERRLDLGRAGKKVRFVEDGIVKSLDKLIEELEKQQQQQQSSSGSSGAQQPSSPMQDSRAASAQGAGETNRRDIGSRSGWGDLPPKEREEALQQIGKEYPAHFRDAIEQYFRKIAAEEGSLPP